MAIQIRKLTTACRTQPEFVPFFDAYARECGIAAFGDWRASWEMYEKCEQAKCVHAFCAYDGDEPIGFIVGIESEQFHYSLYTMTIDAIFVLKDYRGTSVSSRLISSVMRIAKAKAINNVLFSCPPNGDLDKALSKQRKFHLVSKIYRRI